MLSVVVPKKNLQRTNSLAYFTVKFIDLEIFLQRWHLVKFLVSVLSTFITSFTSFFEMNSLEVSTCRNKIKNNLQN
jgi:hypothetical protein